MKNALGIRTLRAIFGGWGGTAYDNGDDEE